MTMIKICGISREEDTEFINAAKPDYAGFIIGVPFSRRNITAEQACRLRNLINSDIKTVGVFVDYRKEDIVNLVECGIIDIVQLHGAEDEIFIKELRQLIPDTEIWKAFVIKNSEDIALAELSSADKILLDSGTGSGKSFDWSMLADVKRDFILAGGLNCENISSAIAQVRPYAVDVSSGVETDYLKDGAKIQKLCAIVRRL